MNDLCLALFRLTNQSRLTHLFNAQEQDVDRNATMDKRAMDRRNEMDLRQHISVLDVDENYEQLMGKLQGFNSLLRMSTMLSVNRYD